MWVIIILILIILLAIILYGKNKIIGGAVDRLINDLPRRKYRRTDDSPHREILIHWGQKKLLLSEIEFLTKYGHLSNIVVYAGSAPGTHIDYLVKMFPDHKFILYDPRDFDVRDSPRIEKHKQYFFAKDAKKYKGILFISDIRTAEDEIPDDDDIIQNMNMQKEWVNIMKPAMSMLKFRLPYTPGKTKYLDGDIYLQIYAPITSTETRLITDGKKQKIYDNTKYEEQMFYFNTILRPKGYDKIKEQEVLQEYIEKFDSPLTVEEHIKKIDDLLCKNYRKYKGAVLKMHEKVNKYCNKSK